MSGALILTGAPGSGKTSVADALSTLLEIDRVPLGAIETEELARGWPWLSPAACVEQLEAVIALQRKAGRDTFVVVATTETRAELRAVIRAVACGTVLVVCLTASPEVVAERLSRREPDAWPGKVALIEHARGLAQTIPSLPGIDALLHTAERDPVDVADEIKALLVRSGVIPRP